VRCQRIKVSGMTTKASRQLKNLVRAIMARRVPAGGPSGFGLSFLEQGDLILSDQSRARKEKQPNQGDQLLSLQCAIHLLYLLRTTGQAS
jgi:hypothetical protein